MAATFRRWSGGSWLHGEVCWIIGPWVEDRPAKLTNIFYVPCRQMQALVLGRRYQHGVDHRSPAANSQAITATDHAPKAQDLIFKRKNATSKIGLDPITKFSIQIPPWIVGREGLDALIDFSQRQNAYKCPFRRQAA